MAPGSWAPQMSGIRALRRGDLPAVCALYESIVRSGSTTPPPQLVGYFERIFLDYPWLDDDIPSLVYESSDGQIVGFLGSHVRRLRVDGRPLRLACSGQLVASPDGQHRGVGALLVKRYLGGPQDITITDGATDYMRRLWLRLGGTVLPHASIGWVKILRPVAVVSSLAGIWGTRRRGVRRRVGLGSARSLSVLAPGLDTTARRTWGRRPGYLPIEPRTTAEILTAKMLVEQVHEAARHWRLHLDYDLDYVEWLFDELDAVTVHGIPIRHLLRNPAGRVIGWYIYFLANRGIAHVLQVAAPAGDSGAVLDHLFWHADQCGAAAVRGRVEPSTVGELFSRRCQLARTEWSLVHTQDSRMLGLLGAPSALLTRLDGEWWMGHHLLWRDEQRRSSTETRLCTADRERGAPTA